MAAKEIAKDKTIISEGQHIEAVHIITRGSVKAFFNGCEITLKKGDIVGLLDAAFDSHSFSYVTLEPSEFLSVPVKDMNSFLKKASVQNPDIAKRLTLSMINQVSLIYSSYKALRHECASLYTDIKASYDEYQALCSHNSIIARSIPNYEVLNEVSLENDVENWLFPYYEAIRELALVDISRFSDKGDFLVGFVNKASNDIHSSFSIFDDMNEYVTDVTGLFFQENRLDLFDLYTSLLYRLGPASKDFADVNGKIENMIAYLRKSGRVDESLLSERISEYRVKLGTLSSNVGDDGEETLIDPTLVHSLDTIVEYSGVDEETGSKFKALVNKYKALSDKGSVSDDVRKLKSELTACFHTIYEEAFTMSLRDYCMPIVMKMFFNFGFVDVDIAGLANTNTLYRLAQDFKGCPEKGIYTAYEWFTAIYNKKVEPSRNSLDATFPEFLRDQQTAGKIPPEMVEKMVNDPSQRTLFELQQVFPVVNRTTYGRLSTYCPVFSESDVIKPLGSCLLNPDTVLDAIRKIEEIDYSAFYRETMFSFMMGTTSTNDIVNVHVAPNVILFPNIGTRGIMWQEIEGKKRTTPARFYISVFHIEELPNTLARMIAEYRWEMCKRVQGARWNDVSERSLTSEYCDYAQFYKKNSDLSQDAKEKVKLALARSRNSFKEMFVRDYITWVMFESKGSPRLNKVARAILSVYCPFTKSNRAKLTSNPIFAELFEKNGIKNSQKLHRIDNIITKLNSLNQPVPEEILTQRKLIDGDM